MSTRAATSSSRRPPTPVAARRRAQLRRRRAMAIITTAVLAVCAVLAFRPTVHRAVQEIALPLRHEDIIRQQSRDKGLDPSLVAAVIYAESRFVDGRTSAAGAQGLMQLTPATAKDIARKSGGTAFRLSDLGTAQVNISYGTWYLRYLLRRYGDNEILALAAYNAGEGNVDRWVGAERGRERSLTIRTIPFGETRLYVGKVLDAQHQYRKTYRRELGL
jgi:soluble lytic murein transglycosylase